MASGSPSSRRATVVRSQSRFIRAMTSSWIPAGQTRGALADGGAVAEPLGARLRRHRDNPLTALRLALRQRGRGGRSSRPVKSAADAFGHAATHAPQPMHAAASIARSAARLRRPGSRSPPARSRCGSTRSRRTAMIRSRALRSTTRSFSTGNAAARQGSSRSTSPSLEVAHVRLADGRVRERAVRLAVHEEAARPADALAAVRVEGDRLLAALDELLVQGVEHLEERHVLGHVGYVVLDEAALVARVLLPPDVEEDPHGRSLTCSCAAAAGRARTASGSLCSTGGSPGPRHSHAAT